MKWNIGCSGFSYKEWKNEFYPPKLPQSKWFDFYSQHFNTLELNVTFYRFPQLSTLEKWYANSPAAFSFAVKVPRLITHYKQLIETQNLLTDFYSSCRQGLQDKLGPILFQFPPSFSFTKERLDRILEKADSSFINVVEFRHNSWWNEEVYTQLKKKHIVFCSISYPGLKNEVIINSSIVYYRFHGVPKLYYSAYTEKELKMVADTILQNKHVRNVYCYFNNTAAIAAIKNAQWMKNLTLIGNK